MTYKLSTTMAEKVINEAQHAQATEQSSASLLSSSDEATLKPVTTSSSTLLARGQDSPSVVTSSDSNFGILSRKIAGGIKLPFMPTNHQLNSPSSLKNSTNNEIDNGKDQKFEITSNSKSKRPISSQLQDIQIPLAQDTSESKSKHSKSASSSSNENLVDITSEDESGIVEESKK
jgi:hypothetical protein